MSDLAIRVEKLEKLYRIGAREQPYRTLRDSLTNALYIAFRRHPRFPLQPETTCLSGAIFKSERGRD